MPDPRPGGGFHPLLAELAYLDRADVLGRFLRAHPHSLLPAQAAALSWETLAAFLADDYDRAHGRRGRAAPRRPGQRARAAGDGKQ